MKGAASKLRVVLDTNVLISALAFQGIVRRVWGLAQEGRFDAFVSPFILDELQRNLTRLGVHSDKVVDIIDDVISTAHLVRPTSHIAAIKTDETDNRILECAVDAKANVIVTGDVKHIRSLDTFQGIGILTPREFLDNYFPSSQAAP